ncbi:MAG: HAMP domain-containing histidine kinase [Tyzzerella sp.]|nr:HAMP domain-containing histidine kinase [Tyzzerella sp.]
MKNNYRKLKLTILLQTVFVTSLTILVGGFILEYILEGSSNGLVHFLTSINVQEEAARAWYWRVIGNNKEFFLIIGYLLLFSLFFYVALSRFEKYLRQIEAGINNITSDSEETIHMITELKPIESRLIEIKNTLKKQEREAAEAEKKKNDLVVYLAHDLKTPLTSIVAYLTMLDSYKDMPEEERERYTHIALEKSIRLGELINEFFDITKFNLQDIELDKTELNLTMMLEQVADEFYGVFQEKNLLCEVNAEDDLKVYGDADKLARVFDNILRNAVSYCYSDSIIRITARRIENGNQIIFSNRGAQIPADKLEMIFEKFYRMDEARRSRTGGAGLGLAIAKKIVELHEGTIEAKSDELETHFIVTLPDKQVREKDEIHSYSRRPSRSRTRRTKERK